MIRDTYAGWASHASHYIGECFDLTRTILEEGFVEFPPIVRFVSAQLYIDCHLSSESALLLVREEKEWDADLITRAVLEGTLKFRYLLLGTREEIATKADEYWHILPAFAAQRRSGKARRILHDTEEPPASWRPFRDLVPDHPDEEAIRRRYSNRDRRTLERRWSFTGICRTFAESSDPALTAIAGLAHGYGMSSHLLHKDGDGVGMVWERYQRTPEHHRAVRIAHAARIVSDMCAFADFRSLVALHTSGISVQPIRDLRARYEKLFADLTAAGDEFVRVEYRNESESEDKGRESRE